MNIGIEAQRLFRSEKHGMDIYALELIRALQQTDSVNQYFIFVNDGEDKTCLSETSNFKIVITEKTNYIKWEQFVLPKLVKLYQLDVLHCTANTAPINIQIPLILTLHDVIFLDRYWSKGTLYQNFGNLYRRFIVPVVARRSKSIITVSNFEKERIVKRLKISSSKVNVIYNGLKNTFTKITSGKNDFLGKYKLPEKFFLFLGNTIERKNAVRLIGSYLEYRKLSQHKIPLVLPALNENYVKAVCKEDSYPYDSTHFYFPGYLPTEDLPHLYNSSHCFLFPSLQEGFGIPIIEAMACGVPVITSNASAMPEVADHAALLVDPYDANEITKAMLLIETNQTLSQNLVQLGLQRAKLFSWSDNAKSTLSLYNTKAA
jgi:glycosyltransferase involved in cell wall biosynthesis